jgi:malate dehydrogenase
MINAQVEMVKDIANKVKSLCPEAIVLMVSNPLDVLTYYFLKESQFSRNKVIGIASSLDSSRFRYLLSEKLDVDQSKITNAIVLGEHGDSMVPIFSHAKIDGKNSLDILDPNQITTISQEVRDYWKLLRNYKSRSQFGIAKNTFDVINSIVKNIELVVPASILLKGEFGEDDVCMGVPVTINKNGVSKIREIKLSQSEIGSLRTSAKTIRDYIGSV